MNIFKFRKDHGQKFGTFWQSQKKVIFRKIYISPQQMMVAGQNFDM